MTNIPNNNQTVVFEYQRPNNKKPNNYQSEDQMEKRLIDQLINQGYQYLKDVKDEKTLIDNLKTQIEKLNDYQFSDNEWNQFFNKFIANQQDSIKEKTSKVQIDYIYELKRDNNNIKNIKIIDKKNIHNNNLQVINQYTNDQGKYNNRYDVTILVNGIPMIHIELKRRGIELREAFNQIERYKEESFSSSSGLFDFIQIFIISNGTRTKYYSNTTRYLHVENNKNKKIKSKTSHSFEFTNFWSDSKNQIIYDIEDFTNTFFAKHTILNILTKYCVFTSEEKLLVMRPYQIVATENILNKIQTAHNYPEKLGTKEAGGYVWHTTGSGKTLTSFKTAQLATEQEYIDKVLFVVDRKDLDYQTMKEYDRFEKGAANSNSSTKILQDQLENEDPNKKIIITTIQKLSNFIKNNSEHKIYKKNIVIIFDECHRSQFGNMHHEITSHFKKYNIFGFTGTPIFSKNAPIGMQNPKEIAKSALNKNQIIKTTEQLFGNRLHSYTIVDAIQDKNVLPFKYSEIKTFDKKEEIKDDKITSIDTEKVWLAPKRIELITKYIIEHFNQATYRNEIYQHEKIVNSVEVSKDKKNKVEQVKQNFDVKGFNSIFAVSSIEAAKLYYSEFKKQLNKSNDFDLKIATIYSFVPNEKLNDFDLMIDDENNESTNGLDQSSKEFLAAAIQDYNQMFKTNYDCNGESFQSYYKDISSRMKNKEIDILIVVNMFLTGFDATTLNTLWVDKWLKMHGLIQAFSRTNRILNSIKQFGNIISFRPLEKNLEDAMSLFGNKNASGLILIKSFEDYYSGYKNSSDIFEPGYKQLVTNLLNKFPLEQRITSEKQKKEFIKNFGQILKVRNILICFDEFDKNKAILSDFQLQNYLSLYQDTYNELKEKAKSEKTDITNDLVYEIELVKKLDINVDYIFKLVHDMKNKNTENKELVSAVSKTLDASYELRSKKELILEFLKSLENNTTISDLREEFNDWKKIKMEEELNEIVKLHNLKPEETKQYMDNCFEIGELKTIGTDIDKILPSQVSRFGTDLNNRYQLKNQVISKLQKYFDNFFNI